MTDFDDKPYDDSLFEEFNTDDENTQIFDDYEEEVVDAKPPKRHKSGKGKSNIVVTVGILIVFFLIAVIGFIVFNGLIFPQKTAASMQDAVELNAKNTATSIAITAAAGKQSILATQASIAKKTQNPTETEISEVVIEEPKGIPTSTQEKSSPTNTLVPKVSETISPQKALDVDPAAHTATIAALLTLSAGGGQKPSSSTSEALVVQEEAMTSTAKVLATTSAASTALPDTGVIDNLGLPGLLGGAVLLLGVIFLTRRLRNTKIK